MKKHENIHAIYTLHYYTKKELNLNQNLYTKAEQNLSQNITQKLTVICPITHVNPLNLLFDKTQQIVAQETVSSPAYLYTADELHKKNLCLYQYFILNPLDHGAPAKTAEYFSTAQNFLLESDTVPLPSMLRFLNSDYCTLKPRLSTFSGNQSIHCIYSLTAPISVKDYKAVHKALVGELTEQYKRFDPNWTGKVFDTSVSNVNRQTRIPWGIRDNGNEQTPLLAGPLTNSEEVDTLRMKFPHVSKHRLNISVNRRNITSVDAFKKWLESGYDRPDDLADWLTPEKWMQPKNNRVKIFAQCMSLYETVNINPEIVVAFIKNTWQPAINAVQYTSSIEEVVYGSFDHAAKKGILTN